MPSCHTRVSGEKPFLMEQGGKGQRAAAKAGVLEELTAGEIGAGHGCLMARSERLDRNWYVDALSLLFL